MILYSSQLAPSSINDIALITSSFLNSTPPPSPNTESATYILSLGSLSPYLFPLSMLVQVRKHK